MCSEGDPHHPIIDAPWTYELTGFAYHCTLRDFLRRGIAVLPGISGVGSILGVLAGPPETAIIPRSRRFHRLFPRPSVRKSRKVQGDVRHGRLSARGLGVSLLLAVAGEDGPAGPLPGFGDRGGVVAA